jgi:hypothetical protein
MPVECKDNCECKKCIVPKIWNALAGGSMEEIDRIVAKASRLKIRLAKLKAPLPQEDNTDDAA